MVLTSSVFIVSTAWFYMQLNLQWITLSYLSLVNGTKFNHCHKILRLLDIFAHFCFTSSSFNLKTWKVHAYQTNGEESNLFLVILEVCLRGLGCMKDSKKSFKILAVFGLSIFISTIIDKIFEANSRFLVK